MGCMPEAQRTPVPLPDDSFPEGLVVTTAAASTAALDERAAEVAARLHVPYLRRSVTTERAAQREAALRYVVGGAREELRGGRDTLFVHAGMLAARLHVGRLHPLLRAVSGDEIAPRAGDGSRVRVLDGTAGLGADALHLAAAGYEVRAVEGSAVVHCLLEEGLSRLARAPGVAGAAARTVALGFGDARRVLADAETSSVEVVYLDPMFEWPRAAAAGFSLLRRVARHDRFDRAMARDASRVAAERVVVKVAPGQRLPGDWHRRVRGKRVDYLVHEVP